MAKTRHRSYNINPPAHIRSALSTLRKAGFTAVIVGGCVRDAILGTEPADWDIATSARPQQIKGTFKGIKTVDDGIKHGTVRVLSKSGPIEITTFRRDGKYTDSRRPDRVFFTKRLRQDLSRRDFTINAMAYLPKTEGLFDRAERIYDPFGGLADLEKRTIRSVGDPHLRFGEDALRIWRALRFASVLDFKIEQNTINAAREQKNRVRLVSKERITQELIKFAIGPAADKVYERHHDIIRAALPALPEPSEVCENLKGAKSNAVLRLALLFGDEHNATDCISRLAFSEKQKNDILFLLKHKEVSIPTDKIKARMFLSKLRDSKDFHLLFDYWHALGRDEENLSTAHELFAKITENGDCIAQSQLAINGHDLKAIGISEGPLMGALLASALEAVIKDEVENNKEVLLDFIKNATSA